MELEVDEMIAAALKESAVLMTFIVAMTASMFSVVSLGDISSFLLINGVIVVGESSLV